MPRHRNRMVLTAACMLLVACSSGVASAPTTASSTSPPTSAPTSTPTSPSTSTTASTTTSGATTAPPTTEAPPVQLSAGGPWTRVDGAPGISTPGLFYELMPKLWVYLPTTEDINHNIIWTFTERDRPIIEGYLQAQLVYFRAVTSNPIDLEAPGWKNFYVDGGPSYIAPLAKRRAEGQVVDMGAGVVMRPEVIGDERTDTSAVVFDCTLDGSFFRMPDGSLAKGSTPGTSPIGLGFRMSLTKGGWMLGKFGDQPEACK